MIQQSFRDFPTIFARLKGRNGVVREYNAIIVPTTEYSILPMVDAFALGFPEAGGADSRALSPNIVHFASYSGYGRGIMIKMPEVEIAGTSFKDVGFVSLDILQSTGFDVVLGKNLFQNIKLTLDYVTHQMTLQREVPA